MKTMADAKLRQEIARRAQEALDHHQPRNYRISVDPEGIMEEDDWYHILVTTPDDVRDRDFYHALADAEAALQDDQGYHYLLVPVIAE